MKHLPADKADIHLEADIHAVTEDQSNGFAEGMIGSHIYI